MIISVRLVGDQQLLARLDSMPDALRRVLTGKMMALALRLQAHIQKNKLSGQVLHARTGALRRSIHPKIDQRSTGVWAKVLSSGDVKYAGIHEFGGKTKAHVIEPRKGQALAFMIGGTQVFAKRVNHPGSQMPMRSFMRSALGEKAAEISTGMKAAVIEGLLAAKNGAA